MYDSEVAIAELKRCEILVQHHLRHILANEDKETAKTFFEILSRAADYSKKVINELSKPTLWMLYCPFCGFEHVPMANARKVCPQCGDAMKIWDLSLGTRPRRKDER